ncbi:protein YOP1 [Plasmodium brasilianum]|uniref:HVA22/TB2/DP1 family protein n=2 Tax=Plasmodium (Plasmodium) TaxID=418103 RepID=A0A1A8VZA7_PLAMA|nr:HVA22/TB2/DP1 family protein, putative [Plasmodium malariae]KAI4838924.1 protein YOP1 [Plasmodium brasilianum]SBS84715.1 HVA22/TB2/DP1 family protein [Plasmodium malariae]SCN12269.1 HVA22/TB2/DP1 family protein, putative [Plasmodium malariae]
MKMSKLYSKNKEKESEKANDDSTQNINTLKKLSSKVIVDTLNNFDVNKLFETIDEHVKKFPIINDIGKKYGVKPSYVIVPISGFLLLSLIFGWGAALICNVVGFAYPAYQSFKAVESQSKDETKLWLTYWVVFSLFFFIEYLIDIILFWVPFYYLIKLLFLLYLYMPQVRGAEIVYNYIIRPILLKHEKTIDDTVHKISQTATNHLTQITGNLTEKLTQEGVRRRNV